MAEFSYRTRGDSPWQGKAKVYLAAHPEDRGLLEKIAKEILSYQNCAVFFDSDPEGALDVEEHLAKLHEMNLVVIPVTTAFLTKESRALSLEFQYARKHHIPILPLMQEEGLSELFNRVCGELQYLDRHASDATAISYEEKLATFLSSVLVGDELAKKVRAAFDAYIFLSYRKKDRKYAQELMRLIHANEFCRDIAIWYDEFLTPGENFNDMIAEALEKSALFTLAVTPNLVNETNYVMTTEYPMAKEAGKTIVPCEVVPTDHDLVADAYNGIPTIVDAHDGVRLAESLLSALSSIALRENDSDPEHNFFIGLAYLSGIDVERDAERALSLITSAAEAGLYEAIRRLGAMYRNAEGVARDFEKALYWAKKLIDCTREMFEKNPGERDAFRIVEAYVELGNLLDSLFRYEECGERYRELLAQLDAFEGYGFSFIERIRVICYNTLGKLAELDGRLQEAKACYENSLTICESFSSQETLRDVASAYLSIGGLLIKMEDYDSARTYYEKAAELLQKIPNAGAQGNLDLAFTLNMLGRVEEKRYHFEEALAFHTKALRVCRGGVLEAESADAYRQEAVICKDISDVYESMNRTEEALPYLKLSITIREELLKASGAILAQYDLAIGYNAMGDSLASRGDEEALLYYEKAYAIYRDIYDSTHTNESARSLTLSYNKLGQFAEQRGQYDKAADYYREGLLLREKLCEQMDAPEARYDLGISYNRIGNLMQTVMKFDEAIPYHEKAFSVFEALKAEADSPRAFEGCFDSLSYLGRACDRLSEDARALAYFEKACVVAEEMAELFSSEKTTRLLSIAYGQLGRGKENLRDYEGALVYHQKALALKPDVPSDAAWGDKRDLAVSHAALARVLKRLKQWDDALMHAQKALTYFEAVYAQWTTVLALRDLVHAYDQLGEEYLYAHTPAEAIAVLEKGDTFAKLMLEADTFEMACYARINLLDKLADAYEMEKDAERQLSVLEELLTLRERYAKTSGTVENRNAVAKTHSAIGYVARTLGDIQKTFEHFSKSLEIRNALVREEQTVGLIDDLAHSNFDMGSLLVTLKMSQARIFLQRAQELLELLIQVCPEDPMYKNLHGSIRMMLMMLPE